jgi:hypothetical protein
MNISPEILGRITADIRAKVPAIQAIDTHLAPRFHAKVKRFSKLAAKIDD